MSADFVVTIVDEGRSGSVTYREGAMALALWWELEMDGAYIWAPSPAQWDDYWRTSAPAAVGRRDEILARIAEATVKQRASSARTRIADDGITLKF
jgi:hypothetical protein